MEKYSITIKTNLFMKKIFFTQVLFIVFLISCSPKPAKVDFKNFNLTMVAVPGQTSEKPEFKKLKFDKLIGRYNFYVDKYRMNIVEMEASIYPTNLEMLKDIVTTSDEFKSLIKDQLSPEGTLQFDNGAFGVLYNKEKSKGKMIKEYLFYFQKNGRYFKITPVFNNELKGLDLQLDAIKSLN
jgi:hypothetical protein